MIIDGCHKSSASKDSEGKGRGGDGSPCMADTDMVHKSVGTVGGCSSNNSKRTGLAETTAFRREAFDENNFDGMSCVWIKFQEQGISRDILQIIKESWRGSTRSQYATIIKKWTSFCGERSIHFFQPTINDVLEFLLKLYKGNLSYSCINTARSALSCFVKIDGTDVGKHPLVSRFMKGIFQLRPTLSRYNEIWDVDVVFDYIRNMNCNEMLSLKQLTLKTVSLVALISSQRVQSIHNICLSNMNVDDSKYVFYLGKIKQSRPSCKSFYMSLERFPGEENLCIFKALSEYLKRTESIRNGCDKVFISYLKPHKQVSKNTIARWIKTFLGLAGINIKKFSAHSTRAASSSAAIRNGVPITEILNKAGWSSEKTFFKYYNLDVTKTK